MKKKYLKITSLLFFLFSCFLSFAQTCTTTVTNVSGASPICSGNTATLTATHDGDNVYWYNAATNGTLLYTGNPYQTGPLTLTTSFWAESRKQVLGTPTSGGGKLAPTSTGGTTVVAGTSPWGLMFNATQSFKLNSVDVFLSSTTPGTLTIQLKDSSLNVLQTWTIATPAGGSGANPVQFTVPLNYIIPIGTGYRLVALSPSPNMIRDLASGGFPFPIGSVGSVTQGTISNANTNATTHYFFYNWNYTPIANCVSARQEAAVTVNTTSQPIGAAQQLFTLGETIADLDVTGTGLLWYSDAAGLNPIPTSTVLTDGTTYYVSQTLNGCPSTLLAVMAVTTLNVDDSVFSKLKYFPNPVTDNFTLSNLESNSQIEIYTVLGQQISYATYDSQEVNLDFSKYNSGIYLVKIMSNNETKTIKILKN
jgi:hypothetical protein